jgi:hypothetical protein
VNLKLHLVLGHRLNFAPFLSVSQEQEVIRMYLSSILALAFVAATAYAHPGHDHEKELHARREFLSRHVNNIDHCASMHEASGLRMRALKRRAELAAKLGPTLHGTYSVQFFCL